MRRTITHLLIVFSLSLGGTTLLPAQSLSAENFLDNLSAHYAGDEAEKNQAAEIARSLSGAPRAEAERALPAVMVHLRNGTEEHAREYAFSFLLMIAIRLDGAALLSAKSGEIASLLLDPNPGIQRVSLAVTDYVIAKPETNKQPYLSALQEAIGRPHTPQDACINIISLLLLYRSSDPVALKSVLDFLHRDDLTAETRRELVHTLGVNPGLPDPVNQYLAHELEDPDPTVRAAALVAFADSTTSFHTMAKDRVERIAHDPNENPQVRELAKQAMAGKTALNPNIDLTPDKPSDH
jgi:hypothetical protein